MAVPINPTGFPSNEGFYAPSAVEAFGPSPMMVAGVVLLIVLAALIGWAGARRRPLRDPSEDIYDAVRRAVTAASGAGRDEVISAGRRLKAVIDQRLGAVIALADGVAGPYGDLDRALAGRRAAEPHHARPEPEPERSGVERLVINARRVIVNAAAGHAEAEPAGHHDQGHDGRGRRGRDRRSHGHGPHQDGGHGHGDHDRPLDAATQIAHVREAIHAFSDHWLDKPARLKELRAARRQLMGGEATAGGGSGSGSHNGGRVWDRR